MKVAGKIDRALVLCLLIGVGNAALLLVAEQDLLDVRHLPAVANLTNHNLI